MTHRASNNVNMENSSSSFTPFAKLYPDAKTIETKGSTCDSYVVRRYGKQLFVKKLKRDLASDPRYIAALHKEFEVGYNLEHSNIVRYESVGNDYIVLDYVDGRTLREMIDSEPDYFKSRKNLDKLVSQLLSAVSYMHDHGIIHLDLKPDNIMLTNIANDVKVLDLGYCYTDSFNDTMGRTDKYSAPEQTDGSGNVDVRTDIFAIGRILQQMPLLPHLYNKVAEKCTKADKESRFQSIDELSRYIQSQYAKKRRAKLSSVLLVIFIAVSATVYLCMPQGTGKTVVAHDTVYVSQPSRGNVESKADSMKLKTTSTNASNSNSTSTRPMAVLTTTDSLLRFRNELSAAVQKVYKTTLFTYKDSSYDSHTSDGFLRKSDELKNLSHKAAIRLAGKYPSVSKDQVEQMWYNEVNGILGSVGQAMLRNDGRVR